MTNNHRVVFVLLKPLIMMASSARNASFLGIGIPHCLNVWNARRSKSLIQMKANAPLAHRTIK